MAEGTCFVVGKRSLALDALLARLGAREAVLVTACNPRSRRKPAGWNARMMHRLREWVRHRTVVPGESGTGLWREPQCLVTCAPAWGIRVARRFGQHALLVLRRRHPPRLWVIQ